ATPCAGNSTDSSRAEAFIHAALFNDGSSGGAGDQTGDVTAEIRKRSDSTNGSSIVARLATCLNSDCSNEARELRTFTATWTPGQAHKLRIEWVKPNKQVVFTVGAEPITIGYAQSDSQAPALDLKGLGVSVR